MNPHYILTYSVKVIYLTFLYYHYFKYICKKGSIRVYQNNREPEMQLSKQKVQL